jgi:hypothetical protein
MTAFKNPNLPSLFVSFYPDLRKFDQDLLNTTNEMARNLDAVLNRGISFSDNVDCRLTTFTSSGTPDAENTVPHSLGKVPTGYVVYGLDKGAVVYTGTTSWTKTNIYLKVNTASVAVKIIVF